MAVEDRYQAAETTTSLRTQAAIATLWKTVDWTDLDGWFKSHVEQLIALIRQGQVGAIQLAEQYVRLHAAEAGASITSTASIDARAFAAGSSPDARLARVLQSGPVLVKYRTGQGWERDDALKSGGSRLLGTTDLIVRDAARDTVGAKLILEPRCIGYERYASGAGTCGRCLVILNRLYTKTKSFDRHPQDDCVMSPVWENENGDRIGRESQSPEEVFASMSPVEQAHALGKDVDLVRSGKIDLQSAVNMRMRAPRKLDKLHTASSPRAIRMTHGTNPTKFAEEMAKHGYLG